MLGFHPLGTQPLATLGDDVAAGTQTVTLRYASQSFVTRSDDVPPLTFLPGRIKNIETLGRQLVRGDGGQFGSIAEAVFGEIILDNADGALDPLANDYFADGRQIRLKIGATEIVQPTRVVPQYIATGEGASSANAASQYPLNYPASVVRGDLIIAQITINDRGTSSGDITLTPEPAMISITGFVPTITGTVSITLTPAPALISITGFAPTASVLEELLQFGGETVAYGGESVEY